MPKATSGAGATPKLRGDKSSEAMPGSKSAGSKATVNAPGGSSVGEPKHRLLY